MGLFICNITEHVKYVSEIRSFLVGLILFSLSSFYHYELNYVVQSCLLPTGNGRHIKTTVSKKDTQIIQYVQEIVKNLNY